MQHNGVENIFKEIMTKHFPNLRKGVEFQIQKAQYTPYKINALKSTPRYIIIDWSEFKDKKRILRATK